MASRRSFLYGAGVFVAIRAGIHVLKSDAVTALFAGEMGDADAYSTPVTPTPPIRTHTRTPEPNPITRTMSAPPSIADMRRVAEGDTAPTVVSTPTTISASDVSTVTPPPIPKNTIRATAAPLEGVSHHFVSYSLQSATVRIYDELVEEQYPDGARLLLTIRDYPDQLRIFEDEFVARFVSDDTVSIGGGETVVTVSLDLDSLPDRPFFLSATLVSPNTTPELAVLGERFGEKICETDRLDITGGTLVKTTKLEEMLTLRREAYSRTNAEGSYIVTLAGRASGRYWNVHFLAFKSGYVQQKHAIRDPDYGEYVSFAQRSGLGNTLGAILQVEAIRNGFTTTTDQLRFVISFVQALPYVPDDVSSGYDQYTKSVIETLVDGGGDCEDTAILMATVLESEAFNYDAVLLLFPGHMAVGVYGDDEISGTYVRYDGRRYYYLETTGTGWEVGQIPDEYDGASVRVYQV